MNEIILMLQQGFVAILGALITLGAAYAVRAINSYTLRLKAEAAKITNEGMFILTDTAITLAGDLAATTVAAIEQQTAAALREAVKAGAATPDEMKQLALNAVQEMQKQLHPQYLEAIEEAYGDVNTYLLNLIEQKVWELKHSSALPEV